MNDGLRYPSAGVRRAALQVAPRATDGVHAVSEKLHDPDPQVRLAAYLAVAEMPPSPEAARALSFAFATGRIGGDRWLEDALTCAASANAFEFLKTFATETRKAPVDPARPAEPGPTDAAVERIVGRVAEHYARGGPVDSVGRLLEALVNGNRVATTAVVAGLVRGWPKDKSPTLTGAEERAMVALLSKLAPASRGPLVSLASRWGSKSLDGYTAEIAASLLATVRDDSKPDAVRSEAARQLVEFRPADAAAAKDLLAQVTPRTPPSLATGLIAALAKTSAPGVAEALVEALPALTPSMRSDAIRALLGRGDWAAALLDGLGRGKLRLDDLSLDQKQALAAHPNKAISDRAKALLAQGGGLPDADRQKVIDALAPVVLKAGDAAKGKIVFTQQCAKCHSHGGEGGKVGPDLTGMAAHPKAELLVHILDPSRSVEGNYVSYTVATTDGRTFNGLLASETKTAVELIDTEGKAVKLLRDDIEELLASKKSLMPEGFEKQISPGDLADLLEFLTHRGKYLPLDLRKVATISSTRGMFYDKDAPAERLIFPDWSPKTFEGVPFLLVDPQDGRVPNVVMLWSPNGAFPPKMPRAVSLPCSAPVRAVHLLSGVSGWGSNGDPGVPRTTSMIVRLRYADGQVEDHPLRNGVEFADYIRRVDVPGSKFAFALRGRQIRFLSVRPERTAPLDAIELVKGQDGTAPVVMAVTVELPE